MDAYIFDARSVSGRNIDFTRVYEYLERLAQSSNPDAPIVHRISEGGRLRDTIDLLSDQIESMGTAANLRIIAHGYPGGIELGREGVSMSTVGLFSPIAGMFRKIELHSCNVLSSLPQTLRVERGINTEYETPDSNTGSFLRSRTMDGNPERVPNGQNRIRPETLRDQLSNNQLSEGTMQLIRQHPGVRLIQALAQVTRTRVIGAMRLQSLSIHNWDFEGPTISTGVFRGSLQLTIPNGDPMIANLAAGIYRFNTSSNPGERATDPWHPYRVDYQRLPTR